MIEYKTVTKKQVKKYGWTIRNGSVRFKARNKKGYTSSVFPIYQIWTWIHPTFLKKEAKFKRDKFYDEWIRFSIGHKYYKVAIYDN